MLQCPSQYRRVTRRGAPCPASAFRYGHGRDDPNSRSRTMSAAERRGAGADRPTERVIVMDAAAASKRAAELAEEAAAAREVPTAPATGFLAIDLGGTRLEGGDTHA